MKLLMMLLPFLLCFEMSVSEEWSECSRSCGTGISSRTVPCRRFIDDCTERKKEYRVCIKEECPVDSTDFRTKQCQEFEKHLVSLSDSTDNSCNLKCGLPDGLPVKKVTAMDGTPCSVSGVCTAGTCVPIGCDGILGSDKRMDKCGRCGATDGVCLHVPCNITKIDEQENVYRMRLPAKSTHIKLHFSSSACNILAINKNQTYSFKETSIVTISGNKLELDANVLTSHGPLHEDISIEIQHCQAHEIEGNYYIPFYNHTPVVSDMQSFDKYIWVVGENYTACSSTCGNGIQKKEVYCKNVETQKQVEDSSCDPKTKLKHHIRNCSMPECPYEWDIGDWGSCSKSCGGGIRNRAVACVLRRNGSVSVNMTACSGAKPLHREHCNQHLCYNHWHIGSYNECSSDCGKGQKRRDVFCLNAHGKKINDGHCNLLTKPREVVECTGDMCMYKWILSSWSNCFLEYGIRIQTREVECRRVADNALVNDSFCEHNISRPKPKRHRPCPCIKTWGYGEWGECHASHCNKEGNQHRNVYCYCEDEVTIADGCDPSKKPPITQPCTTTNSCRGEWVLGPPYGPCSEMCKKVGTLKCMKHNEIVSKDLCPGSRPTTSERCGNNCTQCNPDGTCKCVDTHEICPYIVPPLNTYPKEIQMLCNAHCCVCKNMST